MRSECSLTYDAWVTHPAKAGPRACPSRTGAQSILDAVVPLLLSHGADVTTKDIADAAGIAEGTIFRAFCGQGRAHPAAVARFMDPEPTFVLLEQIDPALDLEDKVRAVVEIFRERFVGVVGVVSALGPQEAAMHSHDQRSRAWTTAARDIFRGLFASDADRFRIDPGLRSYFMRLLSFGTAMPMFTPNARWTPSSSSTSSCKALPRKVSNPCSGNFSVQIGRALSRACCGACVVFQLAQSIANLYLPGLNADIIDNGVATGDTGYIWSIGSVMLGLVVRPGRHAPSRACTSAPSSPCASAATCAPSVFARVGTFSENEVQQFGAPSLITRSTNDVQQVQMLVLMSATLLVSAPFMAIGGVIMALQQDVGLSWIMVVAIPVLLAGIGAVISRMVPHFRRMQKRIDQVNKVLREQLTGVRVVRAFVREPEETARFAKANADVTESALLAGRLMADHVPVRHGRDEPRLGRGAVARRQPGRVGRDRGGRADRVPHLPHPDPDVGHDGDVPVRAGAPRGRRRRPHRRGARDRVHGRCLRANPVMEMPTPGTVELRGRRLRVSGGRAAGARGHLASPRRRAPPPRSSARPARARPRS